uniref:Uncharacterized protein n=1 Tax=Fagus sylvatica TaxID=28930 RepID=A0A2N9FET5_FAGSY
MGDGAGIMGRGRGIGSSPQTRPIAIPNSNNKISSKTAQQNSIISSIHQMRDTERERKKKKNQLAVAPVLRAPPSAVLPTSLRTWCARALRTVDGVTVAPWPWIRGGVEAGHGFAVFPSLAADPAKDRACVCSFCCCAR